MKTSHLFILFLFVCTASCSNPHGKDYSYPVEQYLQLGIPDIDRPWKVSEFGDIVATLREIKHANPLSLPRKDSQKSGRLFAHMVSLDNMYFLDLDTLPLYEKAYRIQSYVHIQNEFCDIYTDLYRREQYYSKELIELYIFGIRVSEEMLNLAYQINESDAPGDVGMQSGFTAIQYIYVTMLTDALNKQQHTSLFDASALETLGDTIASSIRKNMYWFDSLHVAKIKENMKAVIDSSTSDKTRKEYMDLLNSL